MNTSPSPTGTARRRSPRPFARMRAGESRETGRTTLRAKIDLTSGNFNMRDPVIYASTTCTITRQGTRWCIYPMYDFAHPGWRTPWRGSPTPLCSPGV